MIFLKKRARKDVINDIVRIWYEDVTIDGCGNFSEDEILFKSGEWINTKTKKELKEFFSCELERQPEKIRKIKKLIRQL